MPLRIDSDLELREKLVIGHRGAPNKAPENTLKGYAAAWELGADMIELDVQQTRDGELICIHDHDLNRTTSGQGMVAETNLVDIRGLDAGDGEKVPMLSEALDMAKGNFALDIELKSDGIEKAIFDLVEKYNMLGGVIFSSFSQSSVLSLRDLSDDALVGLIVKNISPQIVDDLCEKGMNFVAPLFYRLSKKLVAYAHEVGLDVYPWTINDEGYMRQVLNWDVDGIISDIPDVCAEIIDHHLEGR